MVSQFGENVNIQFHTYSPTCRFFANIHFSPILEQSINFSQLIKSVINIPFRTFHIFFLLFSKYMARVERLNLNKICSIPYSRSIVRFIICCISFASFRMAESRICHCKIFPKLHYVTPTKPRSNF